MLGTPGTLRGVKTPPQSMWDGVSGAVRTQAVGALCHHCTPSPQDCRDEKLAMPMSLRPAKGGSLAMSVLALKCMGKEEAGQEGLTLHPPATGSVPCHREHTFLFISRFIFITPRLARQPRHRLRGWIWRSPEGCGVTCHGCGAILIFCERQRSQHC